MGGGGQKIRRPLRLLLLLQCYSLYYYYYYMYNKQAFFHISILSTDLISDGEQQLLRDYELQRGYGLGVVGGGEVGGGGAGHLLLGIFCTFSWIALSFLDTKRGTAEGTAGHVCNDLKRRQQKISEDRKTMQKQLWALIVLHIF